MFVWFIPIMAVGLTNSTISSKPFIGLASLANGIFS
jgi:hypothetical protein